MDVEFGSWHLMAEQPCSAWTKLVLCSYRSKFPQVQKTVKVISCGSYSLNVPTTTDSN